MGLFDKKFCAICGEQIPFISLGSLKLEDGHLCKKCHAKLSPYYSGKRATTEQIREHLAYRAENEAAVAAFEPTREFGDSKTVYLDEKTNRFAVSSSKKWRETNPDLVDCGQITDCEFEITEKKEAVTTKDEEGNEVPVEPAQVEYFNDFNLTISLDHPFISSFKIKLNAATVKDTQLADALPEGYRLYNDIYQHYEEMGNEARTLLMKCRALALGLEPEEEKPEEPETPAAPAMITCPFCGALTTPVDGKCEYCGSQLL
ncbi:MAG: DUF4428 domain-containing protein [Lachnospiraceae bacterium]|nr:DUF4428 domain-containing protein [Lachnospiraceae bacterium]